MKIATITLVVAIFDLLATACSMGQNIFATASGNIYEMLNGTQRTFASGLGDPVGLTFNSTGDLFVLTTSGYVYEFAPNGMESTVATGLSTPQALACDNAGDVYVSQFNGDIIEITPNGMQSIFAYGFSDPVGLAFDTKGDLFVANQYGNSIIEIGTNGTQSTFVELNNPRTMAFDSMGNLFVANAGGNIIEISTNGTTSLFASGLAGPGGLAFDSVGNLFETDDISENIYKFTPGEAQTPIASGLNYEGLAIQPLPQVQTVMTKSNCQVTVSAPSPYYSTTLQASTDLANWSNVCTNTPPFTFTDSFAAQYPLRFFRTSTSP